MRRVLSLTAVLAFACMSVAHAATITILNNDGAGEGFNDPTAVAPVVRRPKAAPKVARFRLAPR